MRKWLPSAHIGVYMVELGISDENLKEIYSDEYISVVEHDGRPFSPIKHELVKYISAFTDGKFMGAFMIVLFNKTEIEIHSLLKKTSLKYSRVLGKEVIDFIFINYSIKRITAYIMDGLYKPMSFVKKLGFELEGIKRDACTKYGKTKDIYMFGLTRKEWEIKWAS